MIYLGFNNEEKTEIINNQINNNDYDRIYFITHEKFNLDIDNVEVVTYKDIIKYAYYYRIIENTTQKTLIILNELLRDKNRNNLTFNCVRTFLNNTNNILVFNYLPIIETRNDFCSLFDFSTQNRFKYSKFDELDFSETEIICKPKRLLFNFLVYEIDMFAQESYTEYKDKLFSSFDKKDTDIIPRDLQIFASKFKEKAIVPNKKYMLRNKRIKKDNIYTYRDCVEPDEYIIFDIPFNNLDFCDFLYFSNQMKIDIITTELAVDNFFKNKLINFKTELDYVYSKIHKD